MNNEDKVSVGSNSIRTAKEPEKDLVGVQKPNNSWFFEHTEGRSCIISFPCHSHLNIGGFEHPFTPFLNISLAWIFPVAVPLCYK